MKINWEFLGYAVVGAVIGGFILHMVMKKKAAPTTTPPANP